MTPSRRLALTAGFAALPALALAQPARRPMAAMNAMAFGAAERKHATDTGAAGAVALETSRIAVSKATNADVRSFAESEVAEQEAIAMVLMEHKQMLGQPTAPPPPDAQLAPAIAALRSAPRGAGFDRDYVRAQIDGHAKLLRIQDEYLRNPGNTHQKHVAMLAKGHITDHLKFLRGMSV